MDGIAGLHEKLEALPGGKLIFPGILGNGPSEIDILKPVLIDGLFTVGTLIGAALTGIDKVAAFERDVRSEEVFVGRGQGIEVSQPLRPIDAFLNAQGLLLEKSFPDMLRLPYQAMIVRIGRILLIPIRKTDPDQVRL